MTEPIDMNRINHERTKRGRPPLSVRQAQAAMKSSPHHNHSDEMIWFLIGYALASNNEGTDYKSFESDKSSIEPGGGSFGGAGASGSYDPPSREDSSPSSDSSGNDSSSSSSSDSGGGSSGGGGGGGE